MAQDLNMLKPGTMLHVEAITPAGVRSKMKLPLIGLLQGEFILLEYPDPARWGDKFEMLREGYDIVVRALLEGEHGTVIAFKCQILPVAKRPIRMLVISWPEQVQKQPLRAAKRHQTRWPAKVKVGEKTWPAQLTDISVSGCRVRLNEYLMSPEFKGSDFKGPEFKGQQMTVMVENATSKELFRLLGIVCNQKEESGRWSVGIRLNDKTKPNVAKILEKMLLVPEEE